MIVSIFFYSRSSISQCIPETPSNPTTISGSGMGGRTVTYTNISLNGGTNFAEVETGANFTVSFDYNTSPTITSCPGCVTFLYFGLAGASYYDNDASPRQNTESVGTISPNSTGSPNTTFIAPDEPGYYYITTNTSWTYWAYQFRVNHTNCENRNIGLIKVGNPTSLAISNSSVINATSCNGSDGSIDIDVTGGLGGCQYLWSNGETTQDISNLPAGSYSVTITDNNCTETQNFIITDPDPPIIDTPTNIAACDSFQLPEITGSNLVSPAYYTGPNKTGTTYNEGDLIYTSSTLYIYDETSTARTLINLGDEFKYFIPTSEPNSNWSDLSFDDSSWYLGLSGFGSGDGDDATIITPVPQSIYLRKTFTINNLASISSLFLDMDYDDAFVAYINGNEVARANINGAPPAYNSGTIRSHEAQIYSGGSPERFMITDFNSILNEGENILTIQAHNQSANSSDFTIIPFLSAIVDNSTTGIEPPAILDLLPGCIDEESFTITINSTITPTFTQVDPICNGEFLATLPTISNNGITGTWSPAIDNTLTTTYTFAPDTTQPDQACAVNQTMEITVKPLITPTFTQVDPICNGDDLGELPTESNNGITGTWSPDIDNTLTTTYTFAPDTSQPNQTCAVNQTMEITVNPSITPTFTQVDPICNGDTLAALPTTSYNGVTGTWSPAIDNTETTTYTFSPDTSQSNQTCAVSQTMEITVNPLITPTFTQVDPICNGDDLAELPTESNNGITGTWAPAINNTLTTTYTFSPDASETCAELMTLEIIVNNIVNSINNIRAKVNMVSSSFGDNQSIEVIASGGNAPYEFRLENGPWQDSPTFNNITDCFYEVFVREKTACNNQPATSVRFINHPVFFTPNNDGFNDIWNVKCLEGKPEAKITIYDRYGRIIDIHRPSSNGWDGLHNGRKMPSNDYWFKFEYLDMENIPRVFRSHFSLIR